MKAVREDRDWKLAFPVTAAEVEGHDTSDAAKFIWREWPTTNGYVRNDEGLVLCKVYKTLPAKRMWERDHVVHLRLRRARLRARRPRQRDEQQLVVREHPRHQPVRRAAAAAVRLVPAGFDQPHQLRARPVRGRRALRLGRVPRGGEGLHAHARQRGRGNGLPLEQQRNEIMRKRRHGMGFLGLGSTITMLRMKYGSRDAVAFTERVSKELALAGWEAALDLAKEKGPAPIMLEEFEVTPEMLRKRPEMKRDGVRAGQKAAGARAARPLQPLHAARRRGGSRAGGRTRHGRRALHAPQLDRAHRHDLAVARQQRLERIEPSFAHHYFRNVIREGRKTKERIDVFSFEMLAYRELVNRNAMPGGTTAADKLPEYFTTADDVTPREHVDIQAAAQRWVDSSISKTANVPTDYRYERLQGHLPVTRTSRASRAATTFRFNPEAFQACWSRKRT